MGEMLGFSPGSCKAAVAEQWKPRSPLPADWECVREPDLLADMNNQQCSYVFVQFLPNYLSHLPWAAGLFATLIRKTVRKAVE